MTRDGRPLRFLFVVLGGWIAIRVAVDWPTLDPLPALARTLVSPALAERVGGAAPLVVPRPGPTLSSRHRPRACCDQHMPKWTAANGDVPNATPVVWRVAAMRHRDAPPPLRYSEPSLAAGLPVAESAPDADRWSGSFWLVARRGEGSGSGFTGPQLGGSQAGIRIAYALDRRHRLALAGRLSGPLGAGQREAAIGIEWRPTKLPVRIVAEQRVALNGGRGGPTLGLVGGVGPAPIGAGMRIEGYAQAGIIARKGAEAFADGALRVSRPLATIDKLRVDLGLSAWGAAQKGASRLDIGPSLGVVVPIGRQRVRLSLEWRRRIAGNATPVSGPALSLGMDF